MMEPKCNSELSNQEKICTSVAFIFPVWSAQWYSHVGGQAENMQKVLPMPNYGPGWLLPTKVCAFIVVEKKALLIMID